MPSNTDGTVQTGRSVTAFVLATATVLAMVVGGALVGPVVSGGDQLDGTDGASVGVDADLPDVDGFEPSTEPGEATVGGESFVSIEAALAAVEPGDTVRLTGTFDERVTVETPGVTIRGSGPETALIDGNGVGDVVVVEAPNVTLADVWIRNSGHAAETEDAGILVNATGTVVSNARLTEVTYGVWVNGVDDVVLSGNTIVGREGVARHADRGNGIHLWRTKDVIVEGNAITQVRDGIYFSWADRVEARDNRLWDLRYGVHYMYSNDNVLVDNVAVDNDVGYALMVSKNLSIRDNTAVNNRGQSGHGILVKDVEDSTLQGNVVAGNANGLYVYNAQNNRFVENLVLANDVGIHDTGGSSGQTFVRNSVIDNDVQAFTTRNEVVAWNGTDEGNYWSDARTVDLRNDGVAETRHRPAGAVERLLHGHPQAGAFADSPAFSVVRLAEDSFPVLESPGIVDHHPLTEPVHDDWQRYYRESQNNAHRSH